MKRRVCCRSERVRKSTFYRGDAGTFRRYYNAAWWHRAWGDGHVIARTDRYRFLWYGPDGVLGRIVSLAREPLAITDEDRAAFMERWEEYLRENKVPADRWGEIKSGIAFGDTYPPYRVFGPGPAGTLLVQRVRPMRDLDAEERRDIDVHQVYVPPGSPECDVFDREGRYLGAVVLSTALGRYFHDRVAGTWYRVGIWEDELDVQYIVRWRIDGRMPD